VIRFAFATWDGGGNLPLKPRTRSEDQTHANVPPRQVAWLIRRLLFAVPREQVALRQTFGGRMMDVRWTSVFGWPRGEAYTPLGAS